MVKIEVFCRLWSDAIDHDEDDDAPHTRSSPGSGSDPRLAGLKRTFNSSLDTEQVYEATAGRLVSFFLRGENVCFATLGLAHSAEFSLAGDPTSRIGMVPLCFVDVFHRLDELANASDHPEHTAGHTCRARLECVQVSNETVRDLLEPSDDGVGGVATTAGSLALRADAQHGSHVAGLKSVDVSTARDTAEVFRFAWSNIRSREHAAVLVMLHLNKTNAIGARPVTTDSTFTFLALPSADCLSPSTLETRLESDPSQYAGLQAVRSLVEKLSVSPRPPDCVAAYSKSVLTQLLEDILGGNCRTQCLLYIRDTSLQHRGGGSDLLDAMLQVANQLALVENTPVVNYPQVQSLITVHRSNTLHYKSRAAAFNNTRMAQSDVHEENGALRRDKAVLESEVLALREQLADLKFSKSSKVQEHDDYLKISQSLLQVKMEKLEQEGKVAQLEVQCEEMKVRLHDQQKAFQQLQKRLEVTTAERMKATSAHGHQSTELQELRRKTQEQVTKNEEMEVELVRLCNARQYLEEQNIDLKKSLQSAQEREALLQSSLTAQMHAGAGHGAGHGSEQDSVRALHTSLNKMAETAVREKVEMMEKIKTLENQRVKLERQLVQHEHRRKHVDIRQSPVVTVAPERTRPISHRQIQRQEATRKELIDVRNERDKTKSTLVHLKAKLIAEQKARKRADSEVYSLSKELSQATTEFQQRLHVYIGEMKGNKVKILSNQVEMELKDYVNAILADMKAADEADRSRLLSDSSYHKSLSQELESIYSVLLECYRHAKEKLTSLDYPAVGPDVSSFPKTFADDDKCSPATQLHRELTESKTAIKDLKMEVQKQSTMIESLKKTLSEKAKHDVAARMAGAETMAERQGGSARNRQADGRPGYKNTERAMLPVASNAGFATAIAATHGAPAASMYLEEEITRLDRKLLRMETRAITAEATAEQAEARLRKFEKQCHSNLEILRCALEELLQLHNNGAPRITPETKSLPRNLACVLKRYWKDRPAPQPRARRHH
ncbi:uncharacterized protein LOC135804997 isoform X1 [Sycon ciliatum]|uniref:uncharacterized protein LOC135804997 isoform X1 n=1 Tax=Sycon ciliatum TaxID=27933 RepID=UPI0031F6FCA9